MCSIYFKIDCFFLFVGIELILYCFVFLTVNQFMFNKKTINMFNFFILQVFRTMIVLITLIIINQMQ